MKLPSEPKMTDTYASIGGGISPNINTEYTAAKNHSPARGLYELHIGWGLLEPLIHSHHIWMLETLN